MKRRECKAEMGLIRVLVVAKPSLKGQSDLNPDHLDGRAARKQVRIDYTNEQHS